MKFSRMLIIFRGARNFPTFFRFLHGKLRARDCNIILRKDLSRILKTDVDRSDWSERMRTNQIYASRKPASLISLTSDLTYELKEITCLK